jgi:uncharacterized protein (DUF302 family)
MAQQLAFGLQKKVAGTFQSVEARVREALKAEGFGVLTEIDVQATLKAKLGAEMEPYLILGACNPPLAHRAILAEPEVGMLLPCNVVVRSSGGQVLVEAMDPEAAMKLADNAAVAEVAAEARAKLVRALDSLS